MKQNNTNIYQLGRNYAGLTQNQAAEKIGISRRALGGYETGETIPTSLTVKKMTEAYHAHWMGYMHLQENDDLGRAVLPKIAFDDLTMSVLKFQKEYGDIKDILHDMIDIACDGLIEDHEEKGWERVTNRIMELTTVCMNLLYIKEKNQAIQKNKNL